MSFVAGLPSPIVVGKAAVGDDVFNSRIAADTFDRFVLNADGSMEWGGGAAARDLFLSRLSAGRMKLNAVAGSTPRFEMGADVAGLGAEHYFTVGGVLRWIWRMDAAAESGGNAGSNFSLLCRDDAGAAITSPIQVTRSSGAIQFQGISGDATFTGYGAVQPGTDNAIDLGKTTAARWRSLFLGSPIITPGSGTGYTVNNSGEVRKLTFKCTVTFAALAAAALTADKTIATLPAKCRLKAITVDVTTKFLGGAVSAATLKIGSTVGGAEVLASFDCFTAAVTKGLADADLGTSMVRAAAVQGGYMPSFTATTALTLRLTTVTANTNACTQGSVTIYIEAEVLP